MGRAPCCSKQGLHTGPWSAEEDTLLIDYIRVHGEGDWRNLPARAVRVSPYSIAIENVVGFDTMESTRSSSPCHGEGNIIRPHDTEEPLRSRSDLIEKAAAAKVHIEEFGLANEIDNSFLDFLPIEDNIKLDEIIAEYEKLLNSENNVQFDSLADTFSV
ncbi:hypothetical protein Pint_14858 [Pistacia integerrima]|uniref:Uncharacterized protein n=1 Tax=Pistacia integerrima TaxID=434235 RepID=A0ACC0ZD37_9ROSI|nr:hypothetical protein Pint_14858 [Pistacia integerrima]